MVRLPSSLHIDVDLIECVQGELVDEERALLKGATVARRREIIAGRVLGHRVMERAGYDLGPITRHSTGAPLWPKGLCGSIAHSADTVAVALAPLSSVQSLGIDIEDGRDLGEAVLDVADDTEMRMMVGHNLAGDTLVASRLLFSAKEALFKCQAPITGNIDLAFGQIRLQLDLDGGLRCVSATALDHQTADIVGRIQIILQELQGVRIALAWLQLP